MKKRRTQNKVDLAMSNPFYRKMYEVNKKREVDEAMKSALLTAELHAWTGNDKNNIIYQAGRIAFIVIRAANNQGLSEDSVDLRIVMGMASALADAVKGDVEQHRGAIKSGLAACERILPELKALYLIEACLYTDEATKRGEELAIAI